ncbi:hypothetical protein RA307_04760 [Xanthobacteraceae bacterium Astr-EGSB]|uniref:hypothetical protein n=1 Tax=Astrobacterium formosum TaxID=3069710 RepID=UPI0027B78043|nr:hypothetical protein [Xanthobacteraceae bacterium Astr-EGSB]
MDGENEAALGGAPETTVEDQTKTVAQPEGQPEAEDVSLADDEEEIEVGGDEDDEGEDEGEGEAGDKPRKPSRSKRYKDKIARLERELDEARGAPRRRPAQSAKDDDLVAPKESDFPNDYLAYDRAMRAYETKKAIRDEARRAEEADAAAEREVEHRQRVRAYNARLEEAKPRIKDFDQVMRAAGNLQIRNDVRDAILESPKGPLLSYFLAKNPDVVDDLNRMTPAGAARKIGNLEARIRGPKPKTKTEAKPSAPAPKGGAGGSAKDPAKMTSEEYYAWRQGGGGN